MIAVTPVYWFFILFAVAAVGVNVGYRFGYRDGKVDERLRADDIMLEIESRHHRAKHESDPIS